MAIDPLTDPAWNAPLTDLSTVDRSTDWRDYGWLLSSDERLKWAPRVYNVYDWADQICVYLICYEDKGYYVGQTAGPTRRLRDHLNARPTIHGLIHKFELAHTGKLYIKILHHEDYCDSEEQLIRIGNIEREFKQAGGRLLLNDPNAAKGNESLYTKEVRRKLSESSKRSNRVYRFPVGNKPKQESIDKWRATMKDWRKANRDTQKYKNSALKRRITVLGDTYRKHSTYMKFNDRTVRSIDKSAFNFRNSGMRYMHGDPFPVYRDLCKFAILSPIPYGHFRQKHIR